MSKDLNTLQDEDLFIFRPTGNMAKEDSKESAISDEENFFEYACVHELEYETVDYQRNDAL